MLKEAETEKDVAFQGSALDEPGGPQLGAQLLALGVYYQYYHTNHVLGTLDSTGSEHWGTFNLPQGTALGLVN